MQDELLSSHKEQAFSKLFY